MKQCFKSIYGMPIGTWLLQYRMNYAAERLLASPDITIADLAGETGCDYTGQTEMIESEQLAETHCSFFMERSRAGDFAFFL